MLGGGFTLIFSYTLRLSPFCWGNIFEFKDIFLWGWGQAVQKKNCFGGKEILRIILGVITLDYIWGHYYLINVKIHNGNILSFWCG